MNGELSLIATIAYPMCFRLRGKISLSLRARTHQGFVRCCCRLYINIGSITAEKQHLSSGGAIDCADGEKDCIDDGESE